MCNEGLSKEFEKKFEAMKNELKFNATFKDLDEVFFIKDFILKEGYASDSLSRMVCGRIVETYFTWINFLHSTVMPNPGSMIVVTEANMFNDEEKKTVTAMMTKIMALVRRNVVIGLTKDKVEEAKFIDDSLRLWNEILPEITKISKKVSDSWEEKVKQG